MRPPGQSLGSGCKERVLGIGPYIGVRVASYAESFIGSKPRTSQGSMGVGPTILRQIDDRTYEPQKITGGRTEQSSADPR